MRIHWDATSFVILLCKSRLLVLSDVVYLLLSMALFGCALMLVNLKMK